MEREASRIAREASSSLILPHSPLEDTPDGTAGRKSSPLQAPLPSSSPPQPPPSAMVRPENVQRRVDEVATIMETNLNKILHRNENLQAIQAKSDHVARGAVQFRRNTAVVRRNLWWKNMRLNFILCAALCTLIIIVLVSLYPTLTGNQKLPNPEDSQVNPPNDQQDSPGDTTEGHH